MPIISTLNDRRRLSNWALIGSTRRLPRSSLGNTKRGSGSAVVSTEPVKPKFDGNWMWLGKDGRIQPQVTPFGGLFRQDNPYLAKLDGDYRTLALRMRDAQCENCHMPHNPTSMRRLVLMHTPAHTAGEIARMMKAVREDRMPLDDTGIEQPLDRLSSAPCSTATLSSRRL